MSATFNFGADYQQWLASQPKYKPLAEVAQQGQPGQTPQWGPAVQPMQGAGVGPALSFGGQNTWAQALANMQPGQADPAAAGWQRASGSPFMSNSLESPGSGAGGPPPMGPNGMAPEYSNPNNNPTTAPLPSALTGFTNANNATSNALSNANNAGKPAVGPWAEAPEWTQGGGYNFGWDWKGGSTWVPRQGTVAAGTPIGPEVGWAGSKFTLPVAYTPSQDTAIWERNGQPQERSMERALRQASEMLRNGVTQDWNQALAFTMANIGSEAQRQGKSVGWDTTKLATTAYGEQFNPAKNYGATNTAQSPQQPVAPPVDPATGKPKVDPATGQPTTTAPQPQTPGALNAAQKQALSDDPNQAFRYMMQQLGYNLDAPGMLAGYMKKRFAPLLQARLAASSVGDNSNYLDQIDQTINGFGGGLFDKAAGGNFYQNLRQTGEQAAQQGMGYINSLQDQEQAQQYLSQLGVLRYAGANPLIQQAQADQMDRAKNQYNDLAFNNELAGKNIDPYIEWLRQQQQYRGLFGGF